MMKATMMKMMMMTMMAMIIIIISIIIILQPQMPAQPMMIMMKLMTVYLLRIFETHPWLTLSCLLITQGRTPAAAISMILSLMWLGRGRPLMNTPPNWFMRPCPWNNFYDDQDNDDNDDDGG